MPQGRPGTENDLNSFDRAGKLTLPLSQIQERMEKGEKLIYQESLFSDPGQDYTALFLGGEQVGFWPGY
jgi:hypothetical protein